MKQPKTPPPFIWRDELAAYIAHMRGRGLSEYTIRNANGEITQFFLTSADERDINREAIETYKQAVKTLRPGRQRKESTINTKLRILKGFFTFLIEERGVNIEDPITKRAYLKTPTKTDSAKEQLIFTKTEIRIHLDACKDDRPLYTAVSVFLFTGVRLSEYDAITLESIHGDGLYIHEGKGRKSRFIDVSPTVCASLRETYPLWSTLRGGALRNRFKTACARAGIPNEKAHPHNLRRYFITNLVNNDISLEVAQNMAGHASMATTRLYFNVAKSRMTDAARVVADSVGGLF